MTGLIIIILGALVYGAHKNGFTTSESDNVLGGVCAGIGAKLNLAPNLVRVLTVLAGMVSGGFVLVLYLLLWVSLPRR
jgi:phage shock protein PspC (stress-responsive transcriptional regulator)